MDKRGGGVHLCMSVGTTLTSNAFSIGKECRDPVRGVPRRATGAVREHDDREVAARVLEDRVRESRALAVMPQLLLAVHRLSLIHISEPTRQAEISYAV